MNDIFEKQELQNKLQGFQEGKDYSISPAEDGKQIYDIHSIDLKKSLWGDRIPVWCKVEVYDKENEHYRGRFEGYEDGYRSIQFWWRGKETNPEAKKFGGSSYPDFDHFEWEMKHFFENLEGIDEFKALSETGNVFDDWRVRERFRKGSIENNFSDSKKEQKWSVAFDPPSDLPTCQCNLAIKKACLGDRNRCLKCGGIFGNTNRENIRNACWDCGKFEVSEEMVENGNVRCNKCDNKQASYLQKSAKKDEKNQQIANLEEKNKLLNQQLVEERQAKEEVEQQAQAERNNLQTELEQLREELSKTQEKLVQLQAELKVQSGKSPDSDVKKAVEQLAKVHQELKEVDKLTQKSNPNNEELNNMKEQLNNSQQTLAAAAAAHRQPLIQEKRFQPQTEIKPVAPSQPKNYVPYLIGGLVIFGASALVLGYSLGQKKKENKNSIQQ